MDDVLMLAQRDLEGSSLAIGIRSRLRPAQTTRPETLDRREDIAKLINEAVPTLAKAIRQWVFVQAKARGRKPSGYKEIAALDADRLASTTVACVFRELSNGGSVVKIILAIGRDVQARLEANAEDVGLELGWTASVQAGVGGSLLGVASLALRNLFYQKVITEGHNRKAVVLRLTDEAAAVLASLPQSSDIVRSQLLPMPEMPCPWTSLRTGCYHEACLSKQVPLVRTFSAEHNDLLKAAIEDGSMREVLDAVNAIQQTSWAIDERVLRVVRWTKSQGLTPSSSFPSTALPDLPPKISKEKWETVEPAVRSAAARNRKALRDMRTTIAVENAIFEADVALAEFLAEHRDFYLPHSLDFRGRTYAVPQFNHQRSDHIKALFRFADGVPLGPDGGDWLMIHLANCGDFAVEGSAIKMTKQPFENRIDWCHDNEFDILMAARDPQGSYDFWSQADSPFCFLQACFEYDEWMQSGFSQDFVSYIAGAADGSCSGLQHYSAITRAEDEAYHVNLLPRDTVGDIYNVVADQARPTLQAAALEEGGEKAQRILDIGFGRSDVKRNVMTYFYGSGRFGFRDQHMQDTMRQLADEVAMGKRKDHPYEFEVEHRDEKTGEITKKMDGGFGCANVLATHIYGAVVTVAPKADEAATWIQTVAGILAAESLSLVWTTPTGMPVVHRYPKYISKEVSFLLYDPAAKAPGRDDKVEDGCIMRRTELACCRFGGHRDRLNQATPASRSKSMGLR